MENAPTKKYSVILADPAWKWKAYSDKGLSKSPERHYSTMTFDEICALPVASWAAPDCALLLWCTWPTIFRAERVINSWGFKYSGLAWEWLKYNPKTGKYAFGPGYGTRKNLEPCLLGRRGSPKILDRSVRDFIIAPRREHSRKPDEQYDRIDRLYGKEVPRLEMFARHRWPGYDVWGNQTDKFQVENQLRLAA